MFDVCAVGEVALPERPRGAVRVQDLPEEGEIQSAYKSGLGALAVGKVVEAPEGVKGKGAGSILEDMEQAARGEVDALKNDALSVVFEAILSEGVAEVEVTRDEHGQLAQNGHTLYAILKRAIEVNPGGHANLHEITMATGIDIYAWDAMDRAGYFDKGDVWVIPRVAPTGVPGRTLHEYGIFENLAVSWTIIWKKPNGAFAMRSLFTAGVETLDHEESTSGRMTAAEVGAMMDARLPRRHDIRGVHGVYERFGLEVPKRLVDLHRGIKLSRDQFDNPDEPSADVARWYDDVLGSQYFYGKVGARRDYVAAGRESLGLMHSLEPIADSVVAEFMNRHYGRLGSDMEAARALAKIGRRQIIDFVIDNPHIDARPLGLAAVKWRAAYHRLRAAGDFAGADNIRNTIHRVARANMCGFNDLEDEDSKEGGEGREDGESRKGLCIVESTLCKCCPYNVDGSKREQPMTIQGLDTGDKLYCLRGGCNAVYSKKERSWLSDSRIAQRGERRRRLVAAREKQARVAGNMSLVGARA